MITEKKRRILNALDKALKEYGYSFDILFKNKCKTRDMSDLRAIVWSIYQGETRYSCLQIGRDFSWNHSTVSNGVRRATELRLFNRDFSDMYEEIYAAFLRAKEDAGNAQESGINN